jgi:hypothetical protein
MGGRFDSLLKDVGRRISESIDREVRGIASRYGYLEYMISRYREILGGISNVVEMLEAFEKPLTRSTLCDSVMSVRLLIASGR